MSGLRRGDIVTVALQGEHCKPRPALVIQSDHFADTATVTLLLMSSTLVDAPLLRVDVAPSAENGLRLPTQVMIDKIVTARLERIGSQVGRADDATMRNVAQRIALFVGIAP